MKALTKDEIQEWCEARFILFNDNGYPYFEQVERYELLYQQKVEQPYSVTYLASHPFPWTEGDLTGECLVWIFEREVWGKALEALGNSIATDFRFAWGIYETLDEKPGIVFPAEEKYQLWSFSLLPYLVGWNAFISPDSGNYFAFISQEEVVSVITRTKELQDKMKEHLVDRAVEIDQGWYFDQI